MFATGLLVWSVRCLGELTFDALIVDFRPGVSLSQDPVAIARHMGVDLVTVLDIDEALQHYHSVLMQPFECHLELWHGVAAFETGFLGHWHAPWTVFFRLAHQHGGHVEQLYRLRWLFDTDLLIRSGFRLSSRLLIL